MLEMIILAKVFLDLLSLSKRQALPEELGIVAFFIRAATRWTFLMLALALLIAVPPVNALIHGTHVVVAHSMGSMLGIDTMVLLAALAYVNQALLGAEALQRWRSRLIWAARLVDGSLLLFWLAFFARGLAAGTQRYLGPSAPDLSWINAGFPPLVVASGLVLGSALLFIVGVWARAIIATSRA